jgi:hypothetical protein
MEGTKNGEVAMTIEGVSNNNQTASNQTPANQDIYHTHAFIQGIVSTLGNMVSVDAQAQQNGLDAIENAINGLS